MILSWKIALVACAVGVSVGLYLLRLAYRRMLGPMHFPGELRRRLLTTAAAKKEDVRVNDGRNINATDHEVDGKKFWVMDDGVKIHHFRAGSGPRDVLVLHGGPGAPPRRSWDGVDEALRIDSRFTFHYFDMRGCGDSDKPVDTFERTEMRYFGDNVKILDKSLGLTRVIADIECIRLKLQAERRRTTRLRKKAEQRARQKNGGDDDDDDEDSDDEDSDDVMVFKLALIGHSFGAFIATMYAVEFPTRVSHLILIAPATVIRFPHPNGGLLGAIKDVLTKANRRDCASEGGAGVVSDSFLAEYNKFIESYTNNFTWAHSDASLSELNSQLGKFYVVAARLQHPQHPEYWDKFGKDPTENHPFAGWACQALFFTMGYYHDFSEPIKDAAKMGNFSSTVIHAERDLQTRKESEEYSDLIKGCKFVEMASCGHFPMQERPKEFAKELVRALN